MRGSDIAKLQEDDRRAEDVRLKELGKNKRDSIFRDIYHEVTKRIKNQHRIGFVAEHGPTRKDER